MFVYNVIKGVDIMNGLLKTSREDKIPIEVMYISNKGEISHRTIIVKEIQNKYIKAYCFTKQQPRIFNLSNILSTGKLRVRKKVNYV